MPVAAPECRRRQHGRGATAIFYRKMAVLVPSGQGDLKSAWEIAQFWLQVAAASSYYIRRRGGGGVLRAGNPSMKSSTLPYYINTKLYFFPAMTHDYKKVF